MIHWQTCVVLIVLTWIASYFWHRFLFRQYTIRHIDKHFKESIDKNRKLYEDHMQCQNLIVNKDGIYEIEPD